VNGDFLDTINSDNISESIAEVISSGQLKRRTSYLEHKWLFSVPKSNSLKFFIKAGRSENSDEDNFIFSYSTDDINYNSLAVVTNSADQIYSADLPSSISGTVYVRVTDANRSLGNISIDTIYIDELYFEIDYIQASPLADFSGIPTSGMVPLTVGFTDQSTGNPLTWHWNFGDGQMSSEQNPIHIYEKVGNYSVSMTAQNEYGSNTIQKLNFINANQGGALTIYVSSTVVTKKVSGKNQFGQAVVTVTDINGLPVAGAVVYGVFNYQNTTIKSGFTGLNGATTISSDKANNVAEFCFKVTDVVASGAIYHEASNSCGYWCENGCNY
jgi:PKD repeat protein